MATKFDGLLDTLFPDAASRLIATNFVMRYANAPMMADRIEPLLREAALANSRVLAGEITSEQGRSYLGSFAAEALGTPAHLVASGVEWLSNVEAAEADQTEAPRGAEPRGPHGDLIRRLFATEAEREMARSMVSVMERDPQLAGKAEALLHEVARTSDMGPEAAYAYISDFMRNIGVPGHLVTGALDAISAPAERAHDDEVMRELVGEFTPRARHGHAVAEREAAQKETARFER